MSGPQRSAEIPIVGIAGWKNAGKTTLVVRLVEEFTRRGFKVATVKHSHHAIDIDNGEADSARHRRAGAAQTAVVSPHRWVLIHDVGDAREPSLDEVVGHFDGCDLIIVEGYKSAAIPKIEVRRQETKTRQPLADSDPMVIAIAADHPIDDAKVPVFMLDDVAGIADHLMRAIGPLGEPACP